MKLSRRPKIHVRMAEMVSGRPESSQNVDMLKKAFVEQEHMVTQSKNGKTENRKKPGKTRKPRNPRKNQEKNQEKTKGGQSRPEPARPARPARTYVAGKPESA